MRRASLVVLLVAACASSPREVTPPPSPDAGPAPYVFPAGGPASQAGEGAATAPRPDEPRSERAADTTPFGIEPLTPADREELDATCKRLKNRVDRAMLADKHARGAATYLREMRESPPQVPGMDAARCIDLMLRDQQVHDARAIEAEAIFNLRRIAAGMSAAHARSGALCPSASPVPADAKLVLGGAMYTAKASDWSGPAWSCVGIVLAGPQRYQYEVVTAADGQRFEAIARGAPVEGEGTAELFVRGAVEGARVSSGEIVRR